MVGAWWGSPSSSGSRISSCVISSGRTSICGSESRGRTTLSRFSEGRVTSGRGGLAVYVTSHGFGHLNRSVAVLNRLPAEVPVTIRCHPDLFDHWRERLRRPATLEAHVSDVGAVNPPGDSAGDRLAATLALAARVHAEAMDRVDDEAQALRDEGTAAVLCDAPAVPLVAARGRGSRGSCWPTSPGPRSMRRTPGARGTTRPAWSPSCARPIARPRRSSAPSPPCRWRGWPP